MLISNCTLTQAELERIHALRGERRFAGRALATLRGHAALHGGISASSSHAAQHAIICAVDMPRPRNIRQSCLSCANR